jgi:hypothetical protein
MTVEEISKMAYTGTVPSDTDLTEPECLLWFRLRDIYRAVNAGTVTAQMGKKQKDDAVKRYNAMQSRLDDADRTLINHGKFWQRIEQSGIRYAGERTVEAADVFYQAVYGMRPGLPERMKT